MAKISSSWFRLSANLVLILVLFLVSSLKLFTIAFSFLKYFGFTHGTWLFLRNSLVLILLINALWEFVVILADFFNRLFAPAQVSQKRRQGEAPALKPSEAPKPSFTSPIRDSSCHFANYDNTQHPHAHHAPRHSMQSEVILKSPRSQIIATPSAFHSAAAILASPKMPLEAPTSTPWSQYLNVHLNSTATSGSTFKENAQKQSTSSSMASLSSLHGKQENGKDSNQRDAETLEGGVRRSNPAKRLMKNREVLSPEMSLQFCNMSSDWEVYIENTRGWFREKILAPISREIKDIDRLLEAAGLSHLSCRYPATYSLAAKSASQLVLNRQAGGCSNVYGGTGSSAASTGNSGNFYFGSPGGMMMMGNDAKYASLLDLLQARPNDPLVQSRLKVENYLSLAGISAHRIALIKRIEHLANGASLSYYSRDEDSATSSASGNSLPNDNLILWHLFCTFMDENLPSENASNPQPFSSNYFVGLGEPVSLRPEAIQIHQIPHSTSVSSPSSSGSAVSPSATTAVSGVPINIASSFVLELVAEDKILQAHPGHNNVFEIILFLVDFCHRNRLGYLGIGNLASRNIDLVSILYKRADQAISY